MIRINTMHIPAGESLAVDGEDLHVTKLDLANGSIILAGKINGLFYTENTGAKSRAKRLFR